MIENIDQRNKLLIGCCFISFFSIQFNWFYLPAFKSWNSFIYLSSLIDVAFLPFVARNSYFFRHFTPQHSKIICLFIYSTTFSNVYNAVSFQCVYQQISDTGKENIKQRFFPNWKTNANHTPNFMHALMFMTTWNESNWNIFV